MEQIAPIVGAFYRKPAPQVLQVLPMGHPLCIQREPTNPYDSNAIKVLIDTSTLDEGMLENLSDALNMTKEHSLESLMEQDFFHLGYIPKTHNEAIIAAWDKEFDPDLCELAFTMEGKPAVKLQRKGTENA